MRDAEDGAGALGGGELVVLCQTQSLWNIQEGHATATAKALQEQRPRWTRDLSGLISILVVFKAVCKLSG